MLKIIKMLIKVLPTVVIILKALEEHFAVNEAVEVAQA
jgi:hypothetical protein